MSKRKPDAYYIVPEYGRDPKRSTPAYNAKRVRYAIHATKFPPGIETGYITELDSNLTLAQARRKLKSRKAKRK